MGKAGLLTPQPPQPLPTRAPDSTTCPGLRGTQVTGALALALACSKIQATMGSAGALDLF